MIETILDFVTNDSLLEGLATFTAAYLFTIWALFPIWVFIDAQKKYKSDIIAFIFFIFIFPLNIPGLIFYLIIRPEDEHDLDVYKTSITKSKKDNINIPLTHFIDEKGEIALTFNVTINKDSFNKHNEHVDIHIEEKLVEEEEIEEAEESVAKKISGFFKSISSNVTSRFNSDSETDAASEDEEYKDKAKETGKQKKNSKKELADESTSEQEHNIENKTDKEIDKIEKHKSSNSNAG